MFFFLWCVGPEVETTDLPNANVIIYDDGIIDEARCKTHKENSSMIGQKFVEKVEGSDSEFIVKSSETKDAKSLFKVNSVTHNPSIEVDGHKVGFAMIYPRNKPIREVVVEFYGGGEDYGYSWLTVYSQEDLDAGRAYVICRLSDVTVGFKDRGIFRPQHHYSLEDIKTLFGDLIGIREKIEKVFDEYQILRDIEIIYMLTGTSYGGKLGFMAATYPDVKERFNELFDGFEVHVPSFSKSFYYPDGPRGMSKTFEPIQWTGNLEKPMLSAFGLIDDRIPKNNILELYDEAQKHEKIGLLNIVYERKAGHYIGEKSEKYLEGFRNYVRNRKYDRVQAKEYEEFVKAAVGYRCELFKRVFPKSERTISLLERKKVFWDEFVSYLDPYEFFGKDEGESISTPWVDKQNIVLKEIKQPETEEEKAELKRCAKEFFKYEDQEKLEGFFDQASENYLQRFENMPIEEEIELRKIYAMTAWYFKHKNLFEQKMSDALKAAIEDPEIKRLRHNLLKLKIKEIGQQKEKAERLIEEFRARQTAP